jgi:hypothetical protein
MVDVSLVANGIRTRVDSISWSEKDNTTLLNFTTGDEGTWIAGVSTRPRNIEMSAEDFNDYLEHDGVLDMLEKRKLENKLQSNAVEVYSKHVKTIFQVGTKISNDWNTVLNYPIEFVPLENPYEKRKGDALKVKLLVKGKPLSNQLVYVGSSHNQDHKHVANEEHEHTNTSKLVSDENGIVTMDLTEEGIWYLRTIHMTELQESNLTHESNWATLTFEVGHGHSHAEGHPHGVPGVVYWILGVVLLGGILLWLKRK